MRRDNEGGLFQLSAVGQARFRHILLPEAHVIGLRRTRLPLFK